MFYFFSVFSQHPSIVHSTLPNPTKFSFLAFCQIFQNNTKNSPDLVDGRNFAPFLLKLVKTNRRFKTHIRTDGKTEMRFGSGTSTSSDEEIIPNPSSVGSNLPGTPSFLDTNLLSALSSVCLNISPSIWCFKL